MVFFSQAVAKKTNYPLTPMRCSFDLKGTSRDEWPLLPADHYSWGVCIKSADTFNLLEKAWTRTALEAWNNAYDLYKMYRRKVLDGLDIPFGDLFVESCDRDKYNIIYLFKEYLGPEKLGDYGAIDTMWDFRSFYGKIRINSAVDWGGHHFVNVMIHELGHALGLPHAQNAHYSQFMLPKGFSDACDEDFKRCRFTSYDFEAFIRPFVDMPDIEYLLYMRAKVDVVSNTSSAYDYQINMLRAYYRDNFNKLQRKRLEKLIAQAEEEKPRIERMKKERAIIDKANEILAARLNGCRDPGFGISPCRRSGYIGRVRLFEYSFDWTQGEYVPGIGYLFPRVINHGPGYTRIEDIPPDIMDQVRFEFGS